MGLALQQQYGDARPVNLFQRVSDTTAIQVFLHGGQKIVTLTAVATPEKLVPPEPKPDEPPIPPNVILEISILNGWWKGPTQVTTGGKTYFHQYKPTVATANALHLGFGLQDNQKLADEYDALPAWASNYTGTMKRVVQAIWGYGEIDLPTVSYITGATASPTKRTPVVPWQSAFTRSHGIYKADTRNHWLIEIGDRGVLAMPLILLAETTGSSYRASANDDTRRILEEFGGLPSGETFPGSDADLATAIAAGKVLQLLMPADLGLFYDGALQHYTPSHGGWAFSESGRQVDNVGFKYEDKGGSWNSGSEFSTFTAPRSAWGEHWRLYITLNPHNIANLPDNPIGSGSAQLVRIHRGRLDPRALLDIWYPDLSTGELRRVYPSYWGLNTSPAGAGANEYTNDCLLPDRDFLPPSTGLPAAYGQKHAENDGWGCNVHVFYEGETLRRVRWVVNKDAIYQWQYYTHDDSHHGNALTSSWYIDSVVVGSPKGFVLDGADELRVPVGDRTPPSLRGQGIFGGPQGSALFAQPGPNVDWGDATDTGTGLIRDVVGCAMILVLPMGVREAAWIWRELEAWNLDASANVIDYMRREDITGRANPIGYLGHLPGPYQFIVTSAEPDYVQMNSYSNYDVENLTDPSFYPPERDDPQPAAMMVLNAGPRREFASTAGLVRLDSPSARPKFSTSNMPTELTDLNPYTIGWLGSV